MKNTTVITTDNRLLDPQPLRADPDRGTALCWLRRDLRLSDNAALFASLQHHAQTVCVFVFDRDILMPLPRVDRRVDFIWQNLVSLKRELQQHGSDLVAVFDTPVAALSRLALQYGAHAVYAAEDGEPLARERDAAVADALAAQGCRLTLLCDQTVFAHDEVLTRAGTPYTVFTPYKNAWLAKLTPAYWQPWNSRGLLHKLLPMPPQPIPTLADLGFTPSDLPELGWQSGEAGAQQQLANFGERLAQYHAQRDFPARDGSSRLSPHLRFGTLSIRQAVALASEMQGEGARTWLNELIWREFFQQLLWHFPYAASQSFRPQFRQLAFPNRLDWFEAWCEGQTGYPLIDAAMRQLRQTGWMHNRLRMISASFLVKDLLIDWRWGERHFARWLMDFDLAANNGGWQWAASTGCDAQPWFRIFNPLTQSRKFDPDGQFIREFLPELGALDDKAIHAPWQAITLPAGFTLGRDYPLPICDHARQREAALALFGQK